ncbi:GHMP family kinase ATP-binding protein [Streptomyces sp. NPDC002285]
MRAPAKVNLQLAVGGRRADGFHDLANVFFAVALGDEVTATPAEALRITVSGPDAGQVPADGSNLAARAARHHDLRPHVHLHITKEIPVAGGMAGGSADGAAALIACDALWGTATPFDVLLELAAELGSDVPFALLGGVALGEGRGEILKLLPVRSTFHWVFAVADGGLATPDVFRECGRLRDKAGTGSDIDVVPTPRADLALLDAFSDGGRPSHVLASSPAGLEAGGEPALMARAAG